MPVATPVTWTMTAAQLVTPTTSNLSVINAIQAAVNASPDWMVNSTGTIAATGAKWIECKPLNAQSLYAAYRTLFVEKLASDPSTGGNTVNFSAANVMCTFCPDGGASTFTPANLGTTTYPYVGNKYHPQYGGTVTESYWFGISMANTALWLYTGDGVLYLVDRHSATSHSIIGLGNLLNSAQASAIDHSPTGVEWGTPGMLMRYFTASGVTEATFLTASAATARLHFWFDNLYGQAAKRKLALIGTSAVMNSYAFANSTPYNSVLTAVAFVPIIGQCAAAAILGGGFYTLRGTALATAAAGWKTRTTLNSGSPSVPVGYTFQSDDALAAACLVFLNS